MNANIQEKQEHVRATQLKLIQCKMIAVILAPMMKVRYKLRTTKTKYFRKILSINQFDLNYYFFFLFFVRCNFKLLFPVGYRFVFDSADECTVVHNALYSCLRAIFGISVAGVLVAVFSWYVE